MEDQELENQVAQAGRESLCGTCWHPKHGPGVCGEEDCWWCDGENINHPVAELIMVRQIGKGRVEEFACLIGYIPPDGVEVLERKYLYLHPK